MMHQTTVIVNGIIRATWEMRFMVQKGEVLLLGHWLNVMV